MIGLIMGARRDIRQSASHHRQVLDICQLNTLGADFFPDGFERLEGRGNLFNKTRSATRARPCGARFAML